MQINLRKKEETIQGRKLNKGGYYTRKYGGRFSSEGLPWIRDSVL